jgi:hypothetical protein
MEGQYPGSAAIQQSHLHSNPPYLLDIAQHSEPASELDADAEADEDMAFTGTPSPYPPASNNSVNTVQRNGDKIDLQAVDPVLYGLRRSVRLFPCPATACLVADNCSIYAVKIFGMIW